MFLIILKDFKVFLIFISLYGREIGYEIIVICLDER